MEYMSVEYYRRFLLLTSLNINKLWLNNYSYFILDFSKKWAKIAVFGK